MNRKTKSKRPGWLMFVLHGRGKFMSNNGYHSPSPLNFIIKLFQIKIVLDAEYFFKNIST